MRVNACVYVEYTPFPQHNAHGKRDHILFWNKMEYSFFAVHLTSSNFLNYCNLQKTSYYPHFTDKVTEM